MALVERRITRKAALMEKVVIRRSSRRVSENKKDVPKDKNSLNAKAAFIKEQKTLQKLLNMPREECLYISKQA